MNKQLRTVMPFGTRERALPRPGRQTGMSMLMMLSLLLVVGFAATCFIKLVPAYMDYFTLRSTLESVQTEAKQTGGMSKSEVKAVIDKRFSVNRIDTITSKDIKFVPAKDGMSMNANYEKRIPFMGNIDVVLKFEDLQFDIPG
ncbi:DUF4845 domain-containing protein [bacterium]|nr:DUF4845 domain-containing protein [bacterium]